MDIFKHLTVLYLVFSLIVVFFGGGMVTNAASDRNNIVRVVAHTPDEAQRGLARGCAIVERGRALIALECPGAVATALGFKEDIKVFAQDAGANTQIGADLVHAGGNTGQGRTVVVLDTGYNYNHPELALSFGGGLDFVNNDSDPMDDNGHGSHVAGLITADGVNSRARGAAPDTTVVAGKVLNASGSGYFSTVANAIYWAVDGPDGVFGTADDFGADAINMSLGTGAPYLYNKSFCDNVLPALTAAIQYAVNRGVVVVVAAGNSGSAGVSLPGCISYSTTVGAVNKSDKIANFSGRGPAVDIVAPGVNLLSSWLGSEYIYASGTSMATPVVSAVVALVRQAHPAYTQAQVETALFSAAKDLGKAGKDTTFGWGRVRANIAVR